MNLPGTNMHAPMFTLSSIATVVKTFGAYQDLHCSFPTSQMQTGLWKLITRLSLHSYLTENHECTLGFIITVKNKTIRCVVDGLKNGVLCNIIS